MLNSKCGYSERFQKGSAAGHRRSSSSAGTRACATSSDHTWGVFGRLGSKSQSKRRLFTFDDPQRVLAKAARVYRLSTSHTRVHELSKGPNCYRARIENVYSEAGAYEVGAWDGALRSIGIEAKFFVRVRGLTGLEFYITWWAFVRKQTNAPCA